MEDDRGLMSFGVIARGLLQRAWRGKKEMLARARTTGERVGETNFEHIEVGPEGDRIRHSGNTLKSGVVPALSYRCRDAVTAADLLRVQRIKCAVREHPEGIPATDGAAREAGGTAVGARS